VAFNPDGRRAGDTAVRSTPQDTALHRTAAANTFSYHPNLIPCAAFTLLFRLSPRAPN